MSVLVQRGHGDRYCSIGLYVQCPLSFYGNLVTVIFLGDLIGRSSSMHHRARSGSTGSKWPL